MNKWCASDWPTLSVSKPFNRSTSHQPTHRLATSQWMSEQTSSAGSCNFKSLMINILFKFCGFHSFTLINTFEITFSTTHLKWSRRWSDTTSQSTVFNTLCICALTKRGWTEYLIDWLVNDLTTSHCAAETATTAVVLVQGQQLVLLRCFWRCNGSDGWMNGWIDEWYPIEFYGQPRVTNSHARWANHFRLLLFVAVTITWWWRHKPLTWALLFVLIDRRDRCNRLGKRRIVIRVSVVASV